MIYLTKAEHEELLRARRERDQLRELKIRTIADLDDIIFGAQHPRVAAFIERITRRPPDQIIGGVDDPYLKRWWVVRRNPVANVYLHQFLRSDDDRALHDHPFYNVSCLLRGRYLEHTPDAVFERKAGDMVFRRGVSLHRIELHDGPCWSLFLTGPRYRTWGFACPQGWRPWQEFVDERDKGVIGKGCGE